MGKSIHEYIRDAEPVLPKWVRVGFRQGWGASKGKMLLMDVGAIVPTDVYGSGQDYAGAVADCLAREGKPYPPCCARKYGSHDPTCPDRIAAGF